MSVPNHEPETDFLNYFQAALKCAQLTQRDSNIDFHTNTYFNDFRTQMTRFLTRSLGLVQLCIVSIVKMIKYSLEKKNESHD